MISPDTQIIINGYVNLLTPLAIAVLTVTQIIRAKVATAAEKDVAIHNKEVQTTLAENTQLVKSTLVASTVATQQKLTSIMKTGEAVHTLVNSEHGIALRGWALSTAKLAELTKDPQDIQDAANTKKLSEEHDASQKTLDDKGGSTG